VASLLALVEEAVKASRTGSNEYTTAVVSYFSSRVARLLLLALPLASCDGSLQLTVVEQASSTNPTSASGKGSVGGSVSVVPTGGTSGEGGNPEPAQGGSAGKPEEPVAGGGVGGASEVAPWDAPPLYTASFVPFAFPEQYIRHLDGKGIIAAVDMESFADTEAASFEMIPGLYASSNEDGQRCLSFRATAKIGTFFRHFNSRISLDPASDVPLFLADATFCEMPGLADPQAITFRSINYPARVIHLRNVNELWIDDLPDPMTTEFAEASTFYRTTALTEP
jgi:hypothetical protein